MNNLKNSCATATLCLICAGTASAAPYPVPDTSQTACYDATDEITCPAEGEAFYGQDAQTNTTPMSYTDNGDGTVTDNVTGLIWAQSPDLNGDGEITVADKLSYEGSLAFAESSELAGYDDWRIPTIKEMYSLMNFQGVDPSGYQTDGSETLVPFLDAETFDFAYGDVDAGERIIDAQMVSTNVYVGETVPNEEAGTLFGVNFADGRIKGYGLELHGSPKPFYVMMVRGETGYGVNDFTDNGDGTVTDASTGLMWTQGDSGEAMSWEEALKWAQTANAESYLGYSDWRLPNVKELQILVDYTRSPSTSDSAAIDPVFETTEITNEAGEKDYGWYWSSTTHANMTEEEGNAGAYVCFGRAMGYMEDNWADVHGAGSQRSDFKTGDAAEYPEGNGPQGDAIRIDNFARLVRDAK
ncbi:DUF1566 domain-containing protein [Tropicimonas sp. TH_r6]|uniref:Lcl C-terminal domain-containing protein n=1 Tax=Tropicimonas sp. TH_r6 TaxID=3082085 RepID=UPI0029559151|nr:DUF1566 domain-containing protein [Tropicimonas sp. TH_r6]MDV7145447.1 DUF1566 domain-containing protein [Tropicimonas sp. TH_r6]